MRQAVETERWGFDGTCLSDHFQPWWEPGESAQAWTVLGAVGQATDTLPLGTGVTAPIHRYHPAVVAQAFATLESMFPGRAFLGIGSGEALNEVPCGMHWPAVGEQVDRMEEALEIISRLFDGERLDHDGPHFRTERALLHTRGERRPPIYVSAFGPRAAKIAGPLGRRPLDAGRPRAGQRADRRLQGRLRGRRQGAGRDHPPGRLLVGRGRRRRAGRRDACGRPPSRASTTARTGATPSEMQRKAQEDISDEEFKEGYIVSSDPEVHVERVRELEKLEPTVDLPPERLGRRPPRRPAHVRRAGAAEATA